MPDASTGRYSRQIRYAPIGDAGQRRLRDSHVAIVGCGALGSAQAELLARAGVGHLTLIDRDEVEPSNLQRQALYTEADAAAHRPKSVAAREHLLQINSTIEIDAVVDDLLPENIAARLRAPGLILDGADNFETRYLINDFALARGLSWIYGAVAGAYGISFTIRAGQTACLQCLLGPAPPEAGETCDQTGVLAWAARWVAAQQVSEAVKLLLGADAALRPTVITADLWHNLSRELAPPPRRPDCPACQGHYVWLQGESHSQARALCGRNAVQIRAPGRTLDLAWLHRQLAACGRLQATPYLLKFWPRAQNAAPETIEFSIFPDGRAIIHGTSDPVLARRLYTQYLGM